MLLTPLQHERLDVRSDNDLARQASAGDKQAFKVLYQRHHQRAYAIAFRLGGQASLAEDITQECFVRLWQKLPQYRGESQFTTWLHSLCINQALSTLKGQKRFWARFLPMEEHPEPIANDDNYGELDKLILRLPERARIVFVLSAIEGYQHEEIASLLGIAVGTSKAQYHRAKHLLQEMLP